MKRPIFIFLKDVSNFQTNERCGPIFPLQIPIRNYVFVYVNSPGKKGNMSVKKRAAMNKFVLHFAEIYVYIHVLRKSTKNVGNGC